MAGLSGIAAKAAGFGLYEFSARGNAMAGTTAARDATPGAMAMNPAQVARVPGIQVETGFTVITAGADVTYDNVDTHTDRQYFFVPHAYMTYELNEKFTLGVGLFSRFGLGNSYPKNWVGNTEIYDITLQTMSLQPTLGVNVNEWLSLGIGAEIMWLDLDMRNMVDTGVGKVRNKVSGDNYAAGFTLGAHVHPVDWLGFGVSYRSPITHNLQGKARFDKTGINPLFAGAFGQAFANMDAKGSITLPAQTILALAITPWEDWTFEFDAIYTQWSSFDKLKIDFAENLLEGVPGRNPVYSSEKRKDWDDVWRLAFGVEYRITDWLDLRAGYAFDKSPMQSHAMDALIPAHDRHLFNAGFGLHFDDFNLDFAYTYLNATRFSGTTVDNKPIKYRGADGHMFATSIGYKF